MYACTPRHTHHHPSYATTQSVYLFSQQHFHQQCSRTPPRGFHCKIADFGLSRVLDMTESHLYTQTYGTLAYMPPELLSEGKLTQSADVYSFAIIMWELYCASEPFPHSTVGQVFYAVVCDGQRPPIPPQCPGVYAALVRACWAPEPEDRCVWCFVVVVVVYIVAGVYCCCFV